MGREILRPKQSLFFGGDKHEQNRAPYFFRMVLERRCHIQQQCAARAVIHGAVVNAVPIDGLTDADVVDVRGQNNVFVLQLGVVALQFRHQVG